MFYIKRITYYQIFQDELQIRGLHYSKDVQLSQPEQSDYFHRLV